MGLINAINCNKEDLGLGIVDCQQFLGRFKTPFLIRKNWRMLKTEFEALTVDGFVALIQSGAWQPVKGTKNFTADIPEPQEETYDDGTRVVTGNAKPTFQFDYDKGIAFHKALFSKNSFGTYNIGIADESGTLVLATSADGMYVTGLTAGQVNTNSYVPKFGTTSSNSAFWFQLTNVEQYNRRMALYTVDQSGIDFNEDLEPITSVVITGEAETAGRPITIQVNAWSNEGYGINGLVAANFNVINTVTNAVVPVSTVAAGATDGSYIITPTTPTVKGQLLKVYTYDGKATPPVNVALMDGNLLYKGESGVITVGA